MTSLRWLLVGLWMAGILYTSSLGQAVTPVSGIVQTLVSKLGHILEYALLGVLLLAAIRAERWVYRSAARELMLVAIVGGTFAMFDELRQSFSPGREPRLTDVLIDLASLVTASWLGGRWLRRPDEPPGAVAPAPGDQPRGR